MSEEEQPVPQEELVKAKTKRSQLNKKVKEIADKNREVVSELSESYAGVKEAKKLRDEKNRIVKALKEEKEKLLLQLKDWKAKVQEREAKVAELKSFVSLPVFELKRRIKALDWKVQTEALPARVEKDLTQQIKKLEKQLPKADELDNVFKDLRKLRNDLYEKNLELTTILKAMDLSAKESDDFHGELVNLYKKANYLKGLLSVGVSQVSSVKREADVEHQKVVSMSKSLKSQSEREEAARAEEERRRFEAGSKAKAADISEKARAIFEQFKQGKKLTFEELQILQASNLL